MEVKTECRQRNSVIKNGIRLLNAQKPLKRPGWWKGKVALFWMPAMEGWGQGCVGGRRKSDQSPLTNSAQELL